MKKFAKLFALLVAIFGLVTLFACGNNSGNGGNTPDPEPKPVEPYNALGSFVDGGDELYVFTANTAEELSFTYEKASDALAWANMYTQIDENAELDNYKKLVITAHGVGTMLIKLECSDGTPAKEVYINLQASAFTYEWNLREDSHFLKSVTKIVIMAHPGKAQGVGEIHITKLAFEESVAGQTGNFIINTGYNDIPTNVNEYNGTDETFDFNAKWENVNDECYEIEQDETTKEVTVKYNKAAGMEWSCMASNVKGNFSRFNYVVVVMKGVANNPVLIKAEGVNVQKETSETFDGEKQTFVLDISTFTAEQRSAINKIVLFGHPGGAAKGEFRIYEAYMTDEAPVEVEKTVVNEYDGTSETFDISDYWYDGGDGVYTVSKVEDGVKVDYAKTDDWQTLKAYVRNVADKFNFVVVELTGTAGATIMVKAANGVEKQFDLTGEEQQLVLPISSIADKSTLTELIIFGHPGSKASGSFVIHSAYYAEKVEGYSENKYTEGETFDVNHFWASNENGQYTFTEEETKTTVEYHTNGAWKWFSNPISGVTNQFNHLKVTLVAEQDVIVTIKPNDTNERHISLVAGEKVTHYLPIPENMTKIVVFIAGAQNGATGVVEFTEMVLVNVQDSTVEFASTFKDFADNVYTITPSEKGAVVNYNKLAGHDWSSMYVNLIPVTTADHELRLVVKGTAGVQILVKLNNEAAYENWFTMTGEEDTFVVTEKIPEVLSQIHIFIAGGVSPASGSIDLSIVNYAPITYDIVDNGDNVYTFEGDINDGDLVVSYVKNGEYNAAKVTPSAAVNTKTIRVCVKGSDVNLIVKLSNGSEQNLALTAEGTVFEWNLDEAIKLDYVLFMVAPGNASAQGSFEVVSFVVE